MSDKAHEPPGEPHLLNTKYAFDLVRRMKEDWSPGGDGGASFAQRRAELEIELAQHAAFATLSLAERVNGAKKAVCGSLDRASEASSTYSDALVKETARLKSATRVLTGATVVLALVAGADLLVRLFDRAQPVSQETEVPVNQPAGAEKD